MFIAVDFQTFGLIFLASFIIWAVWYFIIRPIITKHNNNIENSGEDILKCPYCNKEVAKNDLYCFNCRCLIANDNIKKFITNDPFPYKVKLDSIDIYDTSSFEGNRLFSLVKNDIVFIIGLGEKLFDNMVWVKIKTNNGKVGWTGLTFLEKVKK